MPRIDGLVLKKPTFDWKAANKYQELQNFKIEVKNSLMSNGYNTQESKESQYTQLEERDSNSETLNDKE